MVVSVSVGGNVTMGVGMTEYGYECESEFGCGCEWV